MRRISFSGMEKSLTAIWHWYSYQSSLSLSARSQIRSQLLSGAAVTDPVFFGMTLAEVNDFFQELEFLVILDLLAAAEAGLRVDFHNRAYHGKGDPVSQKFRALYKKVGVKVKLDRHILETWKQYRPAAKGAVGDFRGALALRDWLAHGRYWTPKFRITYSPADVFDIANNLLLAIA